MSPSLDTPDTTTPEAIDATAVIEARRTVPADMASVEIIRDDDAVPSIPDAEAISVDGLAALDEVKKAQLAEFLAKVRRDAARNALSGMSRTDASMQRAICALTLERILSPEKDWAEEAKKRGADTGKVKSKHKAASSVYATFVVDVEKGTPEDLQNLARNAERWSLAVEGLENKIKALSPNEQRKFTLDDNGIDHAVGYLDENGGINAVAAAQRAENRQTPAEREHQIALNAAKADEYLVEAGKQEMLDHAEGVKDGEATISLALVIEVGGKKVLLSANAGLADAVLAQALKAQAPVDPLVDTVGEILQVGAMIEELETDTPTDNLDDPKASDTEKRLASRHIVFKPDGSMLVSPILNPDGPVVLVQTKQPILKDWPKMPCHLQAQSRRTIEANIASPDRRKLFAASIVDPGKTQGHARIVFATSVAEKPESGKTSVSVLVEPLRSQQGNYPLDVLHANFSPKQEFPVNRDGLQLLMDFASGIKSPGANSVTVEMTGAEAKFTFGRKSKVVAAATPTKGLVKVMARHLRSALTTIADLPLAENSVTFATDGDGAVRIGFRTARADYAVFIPAVVNGKLSNRHFTAMTVA